MHGMHYVVELANAYNCGLITRDELRDQIHTLQRSMRWHVLQVHFDNLMRN